jgi:hypothetical protein
MVLRFAPHYGVLECAEADNEKLPSSEFPETVRATFGDEGIPVNIHADLKGRQVTVEVQNTTYVARVDDVHPRQFEDGIQPTKPLICPLT